MALLRRTAVAPLALLLAAACSTAPAGQGPAAGAPSGSRPAAATRLGGPSFAPARVPGRPMGRLERPIAARLAREAAHEGLHLDYLACPTWDRRMPRRLTCTGWFDGVTAPVPVRLTSEAGGSVGFDARIGPGVVATRNLVQQLRGHGYRDVDCGTRAAYPSRVGLRLVCAVTDHGARRYVVATVTNRSGGVAIHGY